MSSNYDNIAKTGTFDLTTNDETEVNALDVEQLRDFVNRISKSR